MLTWQNQQKSSVFWMWVPVAIGVVLVAQFWSAARVNAKMEELRLSLRGSTDFALELTQALGYGGLIHDFKNLLLRPEETQYLEGARNSARKALQLVNKLETHAGALGLNFTLSNTRRTIDRYLFRLEQIAPLSANGMSARQIDQELRVDNQYSLQEISLLLDQLSESVDQQLKSIENQGIYLRAISLAGTFCLSLLLLSLFMRRRNRAAYLRSIAEFNEQLASSNASLSEANVSLKQFAGIVSHDLKNPLRHIALFNEQILDDINDKKAIRAHVAMVHKSVLRMTGLISSLLEFTRTGFKNPELEPLDIAVLIKSVVDDYEAVIGENQARITVEAEGIVLADSQLIRRVLSNLLDNSLKFVDADQSPCIRVVAEKFTDEEAEMTRVSVIDNGIGIAEKHAEQVFEPMVRLHDAHSRYTGYGIGLSLAKTIVSAHGGRIKVEESSLDGLHISFTLPNDVKQEVV